MDRTDVSSTSISQSVTASFEQQKNVKTVNWDVPEPQFSQTDVEYTSIYSRLRKLSIVIGLFVWIRIVILGVLCCAWALKSCKEYPRGYEPDYLFYGKLDLESLIIPGEFRDNTLFRYTIVAVFFLDTVVSVITAIVSLFAGNISWITFLCSLWVCFMWLTLAVYVFGAVCFTLNNHYVTLFYAHLLLLPIILAVVIQSMKSLRKLTKMGFKSLPKQNASKTEVQNQQLDASTSNPRDNDSIRENIFGQATPGLKQGRVSHYSLTPSDKVPYAPYNHTSLPFNDTSKMQAFGTPIPPGSEYYRPPLFLPNNKVEPTPLYPENQRYGGITGDTIIYNQTLSADPSSVLVSTNPSADPSSVLVSTNPSADPSSVLIFQNTSADPSAAPSNNFPISPNVSAGPATVIVSPNVSAGPPNSQVLLVKPVYRRRDSRSPSIPVVASTSKSKVAKEDAKEKKKKRRKSKSKESKSRHRKHKKKKRKKSKG